MNRHYYNENDPSAAAWIRELISAGLIPAGDVDTRSIVDVQPDDVRGYTQCHWFAGISGWSEALRLAGWPEDQPVWTGSCPCQPYSVAGKQKGNDDARDLWPEFARLVRECKPSVAFGEQVPGAIRHGWLDRICNDLEPEGYAVGAVVLAAGGFGAPHQRQRLYWVADRNSERCDGRAQSSESEEGPNAGIEVRCANDWMANTPSLPGAQHERESRDGSRRGPEEDHTAECRGAGWLGHPNESREDVHTPEGSPRPATCESSGAIRLGHTESDDQQRPWESREIGGRPEPIGGPGPWSDYRVIQCLDGKSRRIGAGVQPLVARVPRGVVPGGDPSEQEAQASGEARVMRLRGYGNAICVPVAAEFVRAFLST